LQGGVAGWVLGVGASVATAPDFEIVETPVQDGSRALKVVVNALGDNAWNIEAVAEAIPVVPGTTYRYSAWARSEAGGGTASFTVGNASFNEYGRANAVALTTDWQEVSFEFTVTDAETSIRAPIHFSYPGNVGNAVYVDNVQVVDPGATGEPLGPPLADGHDKFLGNIYSTSQLANYADYWTQVTPENAGKWGSVEGTRDVMNWGGLDAAYALAKDNGLPFRFHVLVWGNQQPGWIAALSEEEQREEIEEWFQAVADRYPDLDYVEVVNEALHDPPDDPEDGGYIGALGGTGTTGWDWVVTAFQMARDIFPASTKLMINDYGILSGTSSAQDYLDVIELLQENDLIDGIGVQGHAFSTRPGAPLTAVLDLLAGAGLPLMVTEMDVDGNPNVSGAVTEAQSDQNQLQDMQRIFPALWAHPAVEGITLWGWKPGMWRTDQEAYLVRANGEERPALEWMRDYLASFGVSVEDEPGAPHGFRLEENYPNPFIASTRIGYTIPAPAAVTLTVFDLLGREVQTLVAAYQEPGAYTVTFDAGRLPGGVYVYRLEVGTSVLTRPMLLVR
jgi:endo-1,4-beta-xylanase